MKNLQEIIAFFEKGKTPKYEEFRESWTSFFHKSEKFPLTQVLGLNDALDDKASKIDLANAGAGWRPMGEVANMIELNAKPKRDNDSYFVNDQLDENGDAYIFRYDAELADWINTKQVVYKDVAKEADIVKKTTNGLEYAFSERKSKEIDAMSVIQKIYISVLDDNIDISEGVSISALSVRLTSGGLYQFALQLVPSNVSADNQGIIHFTKNFEQIPTGIVEFYSVKEKCKLYVRVDLSLLGVRDIIYNWATPICKVVNIIDKEADFWLRQSYNPTAFASKTEMDKVTTMLDPVKTVEPTVPAFDFNSELPQGFYRLSGNSIVVSPIVPAQYRHVKLFAPLDRKMRVTIKPYGIIVYAAIYTDINDKFISQELKGEDSPVLYENYDLNIPENAVYIYLSGHITSPLQAYINGLDVVSHKDFDIYINKTGFESENLGTAGDSITAPSNGWTAVVMSNLKFANLHNEAVGSSCWSKRRLTLNGVVYETQDYNDPNFAGISSGWQATTDPVEVQKRANNCAIVHIQKYIKEVQDGKFPIPNRFILAYGTNSDTTIGDAQTALQGKELDNVDLFTMAGAMRWCIQTLLTEYPTLKIHVSLPIQAANPTLNATNLQKIAVMKEISIGMSVSFFDCFAESGIVEKFEVIGGAGRYLRDGLHTNDAGVQVDGNYKVKMLIRYK